MFGSLSLFLGAFADALIGLNFLIPGVPFMVAAGYQLYAGNLLGVVLVLTGGFLGDQVSFALGKRYGRIVQNAIVKKRPTMRRKFAQGKLMLKCNERKIIATARLLGPISWVIPFTAGTCGTNWNRFAIYSFIGLVLGVGQFVFWGYVLAAGVNNFPLLMEVEVFLLEHRSLAILFFVALVLYLVARRYGMRYKGIVAGLLLVIGMVGLNYSSFVYAESFAGKHKTPLVENLSSIEFKAYAGKSAYFNAQAINVIYMGDSPEDLMIEMGWIKNQTFSNDQISLLDYVALLTVLTPPVSDLYWKGQPQQFAFQQPGTLSQRNHIRWWPMRLPSKVQQKTVWLGAISFDDGLGVAPHSGIITLLHTIDADVDESRGKLADSISYRSRWKAELEQLTRPVVVDEDHDYYTDGKVLIIELIQDLAAEI